MSLDERTAARLSRDAELAARIRTLKTDPDVVALHVERVRKQVEWLTWISIGLGLLFTLVNVQQFAAGSAAPWSFVWTTAWLLDPMVSLALIAVLRAEMVTARYQLHLDVWGQATKWFTLTATYVMNTWASWVAGSPAQIVLHSVPVVTVFVVANAAPGLRDRLTEAVVRAAEEAERLASRPAPTPVQLEAVPSRSPAPELAAEAPVPASVVSPQPPPIVPAAVPTKPSSGAGSQPSVPKSSLSDEEILAELERMVADLGRKPGIGAVKSAFGVGSTRATRLLASIPSRNGQHPDLAEVS